MGRTKANPDALQNLRDDSTQYRSVRRSAAYTGLHERFERSIVMLRQMFLGSLVVALITAGAFMLLPLGPPSKITRQNFDRLHLGMTFPEVKYRWIYDERHTPMDHTWWRTDSTAIKATFDKKGVLRSINFGKAERWRGEFLKTARRRIAQILRQNETASRFATTDLSLTASHL
jgi:hypothetical protein